MKESSTVECSWEDVNNYLEKLATNLDSRIFSGVYGIPRGGLVLASWLSHKMCLPLLSAPADRCIIIDDICDSGESLVHYAQNSSGSSDPRHYYITTMYHKPNKLQVEPDYYYELKEDKWIIFPWEH